MLQVSVWEQGVLLVALLWIQGTGFSVRARILLPLARATRGCSRVWITERTASSVDGVAEFPQPPARLAVAVQSGNTSPARGVSSVGHYQ
jgi:hypothetical protein